MIRISDLVSKPSVHLSSGYSFVRTHRWICERAREAGSRHGLDLSGVVPGVATLHHLYIPRRKQHSYGSIRVRVALARHATDVFARECARLARTCVACQLESRCGHHRDRFTAKHILVKKSIAGTGRSVRQREPGGQQSTRPSHAVFLGRLVFRFCLEPLPTLLDDRGWLRTPRGAHQRRPHGWTFGRRIAGEAQDIDVLERSLADRWVNYWIRHLLLAESGQHQCGLTRRGAHHLGRSWDTRLDGCGKLCRTWRCHPLKRRVAGLSVQDLW